MPKEPRTYHITAKFKPLEWQKFGHKFKMDYVSEYEIDGGLLTCVQEDRKMFIPLDNLQSINVIPQDKYEEYEYNRLEDD